MIDTKKIKQIMKQRKLNIDSLAKKAAISRKSLDILLNQKKSGAALLLLKSISDVLKYDYQKLLIDNQNKK